MYMFFHILLLIIIISYIKAEIPPIPYSSTNNYAFFLRNLDGKYKILFGRANENECHILDVNPLNNTLNITIKYNCLLNNETTNSNNPIIDYINDDNIFLYSINITNHELRIKKLTSGTESTPTEYDKNRTDIFLKNAFIIPFQNYSFLSISKDANSYIEFKYYDMSNPRNILIKKIIRGSFFGSNGAIASAIKLSNNHIFIIEHSFQSSRQLSYYFYNIFNQNYSGES